MVRFAHIALVLALIVGMTPGLLEVFQDGVHLLVDGRTDHAEDAEACSEHGCAPTGHHCDCCASMHMVRPTEVASVPAAAAFSRRSLPAPPDDGPRGVRRRVPRPPSA